MAELAEADVDQISLESAQQGVDLAILDEVPGKRFIVGVIDLADDSPVEDVETVERRIRAALRHVPPDRLLLAPDCGMKYLPRRKAFEKLQVMVEAAARVRSSL
jgi:5-methyltetrahydropteroyltriglutamate--homocysteine methyltransferase